MNGFLRGGALACALVALAGCRDSTRLLQVNSEPILDQRAIDFGLISLHAHAERKLHVSNGGRAPLKIYEVRVEGAGGASALTNGPGSPFGALSVQALPLMLTTTQRTEVQLSFVPQKEGPVEGKLTLVTDSRVNGGILEVPLKASVVDAQAVIEPHNLDFGRIEIGTTSVQMLHVRNPSPIAVQVTPAGAAPEAEMFAAQPLSVPPGGSADLPVVFTPTRAGKIASAINVTRCDGCAADQVNLFGEGLESAIVADPNPVDFGGVPVDGSVSKGVRLINVSTVPVELKGVALAVGDQSFILEQEIPDFLLVPGAWLATSIRFTPTHLGPAQGTLKVFSSSTRHPELDVPVQGRGGGAEVSLSPERLDFGSVPVGAAMRVTVHVRNAGTSDALTITGARAVGGNGALRLVNPPTGVSLAPNQSADFDAVYEPSGPGQLLAKVEVGSSDSTAPSIAIPVVGSARETQPCQFMVKPGRIDFGSVAPGAGAVLGIRFVNRGSDACAVRNVHLDQDAGGAFFMPGGPITGLLVDPGDAFETQVAFQAQAAGPASGNLTFAVSNPGQPVVNVPLVANAQGSCLAAAPPFLDFGALRTDCPKPVLRTRLENACATPITLSKIEIGTGTSTEFSLVGPPAAPLTLGPGDSVSVAVAYAGQEVGQNFSPLFVTTSDLPAASPFLVPLLGEAVGDGLKTDDFTQADGTKADVLFVVDNTASMAEEQPRLQAAIPAFVQAARAQGMDLHVAVTTTGIAPEPNGACPGGAHGGEAGRLFPADGSQPRIVDLASFADPAGAISADLSVGYCHHLEQGLEAMRRALSAPLVDHADDARTALPNDGNLGFLRDDAQLSVVVVSDEDDHSGDLVDDYAAFLRSVKGVSQPQRVSFYAIAPTRACASSSGASAPRYAQMAQATGGQVWDVCDASYDPALGQIADRAFGNTSRFPLTGKPDPATLAVSVDGQPAPANSWIYEAQDNAVVFQLGAVPATGAHVSVTYREVCR